jgi:hypothetical protein
MAATEPTREPDRMEDRPRPTLAPTNAPTSRRWLRIVIGLVVLAAIAVIGYMILYPSGGGGYGGGSSSGGSGGTGGGGYLVLAFTGDQIRRVIRRTQDR